MAFNEPKNQKVVGSNLSNGRYFRDVFEIERAGVVVGRPGALVADQLRVGPELIVKITVGRKCSGYPEQSGNEESNDLTGFHFICRKKLF